MKKVHLSLQEMSKMFDLKTLLKLLSNAGKAIDNLDEAEKPTKELIYIFSTLGSYCERVAKNLDAYGRSVERISLSDPRQEALFMKFCYAIGVTDSHEKRLGSLSKEDRLEFDKAIQATKKIYEKLFKINYKMYFYIKNVEENNVSFSEIKKAVDKAYGLIDAFSKDEELEDVFSLLLKHVKRLQNKETIEFIVKMINTTAEKAELLASRLCSDEKAEFYTDQIRRCINIVQNIANRYYLDPSFKQEDVEYFMLLTVELMSEYYNQMKSEYNGQERFVFQKRSSLGKMDKRETTYLKQVDQFVEEMEKDPKKERPDLEVLPAMEKYTQAFNEVLDKINAMSLNEERKSRLSP